MEVADQFLRSVSRERAEDDEGDKGDYVGDNKLPWRCSPELSAEYGYSSAPLIEQWNSHHCEGVHE